MLSPTKLFFVNKFTNILPPSRLYRLKSVLYHWAGVNLGNDVRIISSVQIHGCGNLIIGEGTFIGHNTNIYLGGGEVIIGSNVDISSNVTIHNGTHIKDMESMERVAGKPIYSPIMIGDGCWIGVSSTIIAGSKVGPYTIVGAGSVVRKTLEERSVYVSNKLVKIA